MYVYNCSVYSLIVRTIILSSNFIIYHLNIFPHNIYNVSLPLMKIFDHSIFKLEFKIYDFYLFIN